LKRLLLLVALIALTFANVSAIEGKGKGTGQPYVTIHTEPIVWTQIGCDSSSESQCTIEIIDQDPEN